MAEDNAWNDAIEPEETPVDALVETEPSPEIPNEAIDRTGLEDDGTLQEVIEEEDPEAWRNIRLEEDAGKVHHMLMEAAKKSPAVERALASASSLKTKRAADEREQELVERLEAAERRAKMAEVAGGDLFWGRMSQDQLGQYLARNPQHLPQYNNYHQLKQEMRTPQQTPPSWVKNLVNDANSMVNQAAPYLPEEYENQLRTALKNPATFAPYADRPHQLIIDLKESIDTVLKGGNNGAVQVDATPRSPAPTSSGQSRNESRVQASPANPGIGKFAPDASKRSVPSGGGAPITRAALEALDEDGYASLLKRHGAKTGQELFRRGIIVD